MTDTAAGPRPPVRRRARWLAARVVAVRSETSTARTLVLEVPGWPGHVAGQHLDVRLTAPDGYTAQRSYSIAAPADGDRVELTVQRVPAGEVSPYLVDDVLPGDEFEVLGPVGGWFAWHPADGGPVLLVAGGSGIVPLMAMVRERARVADAGRFTLLYSVRGPAEVFYGEELRGLADAEWLDLRMVHTRTAPPGSRAAGRLAAADLTGEVGGRVYVCGPTGFVTAASDLLLAAGHDPANIRTERFGPSGG
ncbi:ferredoxin reductase [Actinophytocola xanthii]|uniref:Oxidoreductase n=1 Tax=Actinophytocola xanthii TaxID=1912961 RepID=A0A1Q8CW99_9PSEU|nr:ferredoxin reductase [Actinophytocola xanthii]OLF18612.1 oxidoreductase [Actinophytocola xanthii]